MRSFDSLELAEGFMQGAGSRAIGFFSSPESTEHSVYLTVAKQLGRSPSTAPMLARATIGRGTKGCTVYMVPSTPVRTPSGSYIVPLLQHRFLLPDSAADHRGMEMRHQSDAGSSTPDADFRMDFGMTGGAWEGMLEEEAMRLHRFLQAGALRSVSELTAASMEGPAPLLEAAAVGLLLLPRGASASVRDYHLRRLRKLADSFPRWSCDSRDPPGALPPHSRPAARVAPAQPAVQRRLLPHAPPSPRSDPVWLGKLPRCTIVVTNATVNFAFISTGGDGGAGGGAGAALNILLTALGAKLGLGPTALPQPGREAGFALLTRRQTEGTKASRGERRGGRRSPPWRVHMLPGAASAASIEAFCVQHCPWRSASTLPAMGAAGSADAGRNSGSTWPQEREAASHDEVATARSGSATACVAEGPGGEDDMEVCDTQ